MQSGHLLVEYKIFFAESTTDDANVLFVSVINGKSKTVHFNNEAMSGLFVLENNSDLCYLTVVSVSALRVDTRTTAL